MKLPQLQRSALIAITKCYRTVATNTLCTLSGCLPMNLLINRELDYAKQLSRIKLNNVHFNLNLRAISYSFNQVKLHYNIRDASCLGNYN